jgi:hypothetical protein
MLVSFEVRALDVAQLPEGCTVLEEKWIEGRNDEV